MSAAVKQMLNECLREALDLRFGIALPPTQAAPQQLLDTLLDVRRRLDRVEELLGRTLRMRATAQRAATLTGVAADDAWDAAVTKARTAPVGREEYSSAKERHAEANLAVLDLRRTARTAAESAHLCDEAVDVLRLTHRGLDGVRHDVLTILRALQFESSMER